MKMLLVWLSVLIGGTRPTGEVYQIAIFLSRECPISQKYVSTLNAIYDTYGDQRSFEWSFVMPGSSSKRELREFVREYNVQFPLVRDNRALRKTRMFKAMVTPEVVILHDGEIVYRGAIDNWFYALGRYRTHVTEHYLIGALEAILHHREPSVRETTPVGCPIEQTKLKRP